MLTILTLLETWEDFNKDERLSYTSTNISTLKSRAIDLIDNAKKIINDKYIKLLTKEQFENAIMCIHDIRQYLENIENNNVTDKHNPFNYLTCINYCLSLLMTANDPINAAQQWPSSDVILKSAFYKLYIYFLMHANIFLRPLGNVNVPQEKAELKKEAQQELDKYVVLVHDYYNNILILLINSLYVDICSILPSVQNPSKLKSLLPFSQDLESFLESGARKLEKLEQYKELQEYRFKEKESASENISTDGPTTILTLKETADSSSESVTCKERYLEKYLTDSLSQIFEDAQASSLQSTNPQR